MSTTLFEGTRIRAARRMINARIAQHITQIATEHQASRGHPLAIFANDLIGIQINQFGIYEREELDFLFQFLKPLQSVFAKGTAFDVGANIGNHTLYFAKLFKRVHAFEPNPRTFELLRFNTQWSVDVEVHCHGLGDSLGVFELIEHKTNLGGSSILIGDKCADNVVAVNIETLDSGSVDATDLCFMKIDVEGFEAQVINGGIDTLKQYQPVIVLEQHASEFNGGSSPALDLLTSMGYGFCWQQHKSPTRSWITRRLHNLKEFIFGIRHSIATGAIVPHVNHSMLIAVPPRFKQLLGMK